MLGGSGSCQCTDDLGLHGTREFITESVAACVPWPSSRILIRSKTPRNDSRLCLPPVLEQTDPRISPCGMRPRPPQLAAASLAQQAPRLASQVYVLPALPSLLWVHQHPGAPSKRCCWAGDPMDPMACHHMKISISEPPIHLQRVSLTCGTL